jgi:hypothetical protein
MTGFLFENRNESSRPIKTVDILISSSSVHSTVDGRAAAQCSTAATKTRISAAEEHRPCSLPPPSTSDDEALSAKTHGSRPRYGQSYGCCWIVIPPNTDRARPTQRMQSGQVVYVRSPALLLARLLSLEVNDQQKRAQFEVANVLLDAVSVINTARLSAVSTRCFVGEVHCHSLPPNTNDA